MAKKPTTPKAVEALRHAEDKRKNIPTAEHQSVLEHETKRPKEVRYPRNTDLDPQLVWRGKDEQDWSDLVVKAPPLYIQEKVHPKALIDDLLAQTKAARAGAPGHQLDLFAEFNGIPEGADKTEFYQHEQNWTNRMILGDSLQVMASLAEREGLRGKVQCIYFDPPYGIKFNSNFQWSTTSRDVKDGKGEHITREPEQVKAFRDTWRDGIHSYLTYIRDRLTVARDLLTESGSIFVQIGDENVHRVRDVLDEVFGDENCCSIISLLKSSSTSSPSGSTDVLSSTTDFVLWYARDRSKIKYRQVFSDKGESKSFDAAYRHQGPEGVYRLSDLTSQKPTTVFDFGFEGRSYSPLPRGWRTIEGGMVRVAKADRLQVVGKTLSYRQYLGDYPVTSINNMWSDTVVSGFHSDKLYVVQTSPKIVERCILMASDPGDLVLDPTCGSGTTATVAEQWGRRWITIDTSRVALALARARIMGARYPFYLLADSRDGQAKEAEVTRSSASSKPVYGSIRQGFVYERVPHITLKSIANNAEIDVIYEKWQAKLEPLREKLNAAVKKSWAEWELPREADAKWPEPAKKLLADWWQARIARQKEIDASIAAKAEFEKLYDRPYEDKKRVRVAGPFTVESLSPHRTLGLDENGEAIDPLAAPSREKDASPATFEQMILDNLRTAGVQQANKQDRIEFTSLIGWPGQMICAEARYQEGDAQKRAGIFIGPEFGTVGKEDLVIAAREAGDANFDVLIACAFSYEAHASEFTKLGRIPVLKSRMNADLHMAKDLKSTAKANLFVVFGEPDIAVLPHGKDEIQIKVNGVDVFDPTTGEVRSDGPDGIACWFVDTDYNGESFFVRHAYFLGANDPYKALKTTLKAEIDQEAWASLHSDTSRPFAKPKGGRVAVKVINHLGDEVMRVIRA
jgi:adenine-specific DNA-methyltransferase